MEGEIVIIHVCVYRTFTEIQNKFTDIYRNTEQIYGHLLKYGTNLRTFTEIRNKFTDIYVNTEQIYENMEQIYGHLRKYGRNLQKYVTNLRTFT